jgi:hypothetical protein
METDQEIRDRRQKESEQDEGKHTVVTISDMDGSHQECSKCKERPPFGFGDCVTDMSAVLPWWLIKIEKLEKQVMSYQKKIIDLEQYVEDLGGSL